jgi:hypothetical protein
MLSLLLGQQYLLHFLIVKTVYVFAVPPVRLQMERLFCGMLTGFGNVLH